MTVRFEKNRLTPKDYVRLRPEIPYRVAEKAIAGSSMTICAIAEDVLGMLRVISDGAMFCYIQDLFVRESYRGRGLGRALLEQALFWIEEELELDEYLIVSLLAAPGTESFYEGIGFARTPNDLVGCAMQCILQGNRRE